MFLQILGLVVYKVGCVTLDGRSPPFVTERDAINI